MDLREFKPIRDWRAFTSDVDIIVLGVLIAPGADQASKARWNHLGAAVETATYNVWASRDPGVMAQRPLDVKLAYGSI